MQSRWVRQTECPDRSNGETIWIAILNSLVGKGSSLIFFQNRICSYFLQKTFVGHNNISVTIIKKCLALYGDQVEIHYAVNEEFANRLSKLVPDVKFHVYELREETEYKGHKNWLVEVMQQFGALWSANSLESLLSSMPIFAQTFDSLISSYDDLSKIVDQVQPNFIIYDHIFSMAAGKDRGIPWGNLFRFEFRLQLESLN